MAVKAIEAEGVRSLSFEPMAMTTVYPSGIPVEAQAVRAPFNWRHADLTQVADFLKAEKACGRFRPSFKMDF